MAQKINLGPATEHLRLVEQSPRVASQQPLLFFPLLSDHYELLKERLQRILDSNLVPRVYKRALIEPFYQVLEENDESWLEGELGKKGTQIQNIVGAIIQNFDPDFEGKAPRANTEAFREVVSDLYQSFIQESSEGALAPLPHWTEEDLTTCSFPNSDLGVDISLLNLPSRYATGTPIAWGYLCREVAGRDILKSYDGALKELKNRVHQAMNRNKLAALDPYWIQWFEEGVADILGVLNMGPAAAFSLIGFLRAQSDELRLSSICYVNDKHSIDLVRGYIVAETLKMIMTEQQRAKYVDQVMEELERDAKDVSHLKWDVVMLGDVKKLPELLRGFYTKSKQDPPSSMDHVCQARELIGNPRWKDEFVEFLASKKISQTKKAAANQKTTCSIGKENSFADFKKSVNVFVQTVVKSQLQALNGLSLLELRSWNEEDERISSVFRMLLQIPSGLDPAATYKSGFSASHIVSAAVMESITVQGEGVVQDKFPAIFARMVEMLQTMHKTNPDWQITKELAWSTASTEEDLLGDENSS